MKRGLFRTNRFASLAMFYRATISVIAALIAWPLAAQDYVGSGACKSCHLNAWKNWQGSHHALAWQPPGGSFVTSAPFAGENLMHDGGLTTFFRRAGKLLVNTTDRMGEPRDYTVTGIVGAWPLQQFLVEKSPGRTQVLDLAWDVERKRWYDLYPSIDIAGDDGLHWTGAYKSWDARCAECHATGFRKVFEPATMTYASDWAEMAVGCEACHGPGQAHLAWAQAAKLPDDGTVGAKGLRFDSSDPSAQIGQCAFCHSRRSPFGIASPIAGDDFNDHYALTLLGPGMYHPDGQILGEAYVYGSFLQSRMAQAGVRCSDCHQVHSATLAGTGNELCTRCHNPAGNPKFPELVRADYNGPAHHFHEIGQPGADCVDCHMRAEIYMGIDDRRDHSFRVPRPDLSAALGTPNACLDCHTDRSNAWAIEMVERHKTQNRLGEPHIAELLATAWQGRPDIRAILIEAAKTEQPAIVRASLLQAIANATNPTLSTQTIPFLRDSDPLVRRAAIALQQGADPVVRTKRLAPLLSDPAKAVRIEAVRNLIDAPIDRLSTAQVEPFKRAAQDYFASLSATADFPETQLAIGGTAMARRQFDAALMALTKATTMDPQLVEAWQLRVRILVAMDNHEAAASTLHAAMQANPENALLKQLLSSVEIK